MEVLSVADQFGGMNMNRPMTAMSFKDKKTLGSTCPVIIKHEFPNEQKHYIDNIGQEMSSTKKRFIYDRPNTAKIQQNSMSQQNGGWGMKRSQSGLGLSVPSSAGGMKRNSASAISQSQYQLNSADLYNKLLEGQKIKKESRFVIKPARKLNTFQIHSALFKIKKQKEELDYKIRELEDLKSNFNEMDFYLIANSGAVDYMFNAGTMMQQQNDDQTNNYLSQTDSGEHDQIFENNIPSLANIQSISISNSQKEFNKSKAASQKKLSYSTSQGNQVQARPKTSIPKLSGSKAVGANKNRAATAKTNSRDQIEMLRGESRDESRDKLTVDLEILGNCMKIFQDEERVQVQEWGRNIEQSDQVKDQIESIGSNLPTINRLLSAKNMNAPQNPQFGEIKEEEEQEDLQFQPFEQLQKQFHEQNYQQYLYSDDANNNHNTNNPYNNTGEQNLNKIGNPQYLQNQNQNAPSQEGSIRNVIQNQQADNSNGISPQTINPQPQQYGIYPAFQRKDKKNSSKRIHSATAQHGLFRPSSAANQNFVQQLQYQQQFQQQSNGQIRPMTAMTAKTSHHALMSYGPVQVVKERITRNYDHLEILAESKSLERQRQIKEKNKIGHQFDWQSLKVSGARLQINTDTFMDLNAKSRQAMANMNLIQQVDLNGNSHHNYMQNNLPSTESHFFSVPSSIKQNNTQFKGIPTNKIVFPNQNQLTQQQQQQYQQQQQLQQQYQQQQQQQQLQQQQLQMNKIPSSDQAQINPIMNFQQLHSISQNPASQDSSSNGFNRAAIDLNQMQLDQSVKFMRPNTAKPGSASSSRGFVKNGNLPYAQLNVNFGGYTHQNGQNVNQNWYGYQGRSEKNDQQNINVPFTESVGYKINQLGGNESNVNALSDVVFENASVNFNLLQINQSLVPNQRQSSSSQPLKNFQDIQMASSNDPETINQVGSLNSASQPLSSLQNPPNLQTYQTVGQQQFQFQQIDQENRNINQNDDLTIKKKSNRPQTAVKK